jgi:hypothetical protein
MCCETFLSVTTSQAFSNAQVVVTDVDSSPLFSEPAREALLANDVRSCVSTPMVDDDGAVRGIVSTHQPCRAAVPTQAELGQLRRMAGQCGRWLQWYDHLVLPTVVAAVHEAAEARASGGDSSLSASLADPAVRPLPTRPECSPTATASIKAILERCSPRSPVGAVSHFTLWPLS